MAEKPNDSPAFRLRPRSEPKSYYTIRLEYSANPAAFTRERPRSSLTKRRTTSTKASYANSKSKGGKAAKLPTAGGGGQVPVKVAHVTSREDIEREERRKRLKREISQSISTNTLISPFFQRLELDQLKASSLYEHNYITLKIESVTKVKQQATSVPSAANGPNGQHQQTSGHAHIICRCSGTDSSSKSIHLNVHLHNEFAREELVEVNKFISIAKFRTGPAKGLSNQPPIRSDDVRSTNGNEIKAEQAARIDFDVIVKYDAGPSPSTTTSGAGSGTSHRSKPVLPYVCITDMIEEPTDPYVDMPLPSPPLPPQIQQPKPYIPDASGAGGSSFRYEQKARAGTGGD